MCMYILKCNYFNLALSILRDDPAVNIRSLQFFHNGCCDNRNGISIAKPMCEWNNNYYN